MDLDGLDERFAEVLTKHRLLIIQNLQMDRTFLFDYLISKKSFDKTDYELIQAEKTSESKAGRFLDILVMKGETAFYHFLDALQVLNPNIYETITGESATKRINPIFTEMKSHTTFGGGANFLDVEILSNYVKRLSEELQDLALRHDQVLKDYNELRLKFEDSVSEQARKQRKIKALEKQICDTEEALVSEARVSAGKAGEDLLQRYAVVQREGRTNQFIIQLQMKLLTAHEENETLRKQMEDARGSNNELLKQLSKVNEDYAFKKKETSRLSKQLKSQSAEMKSCEWLKLKLREVQFENGKLQCELQEKESEVLELTKVKHWTEALTARFDLIKAEKEQALKNQEIVESKCASQRDENSDLKIRLNHKEREIEELRRSTKEVEDISRIYREERDFYSKAMTETALELEQMRQDREEAAQRHKKMLESKEASIRHQAEYLRQFETKYEESKEELEIVKLKLNQEKEDNEELRKRVSNLELALQKKEPSPKPYLEEDDAQNNRPNRDSDDETEPSEAGDDIGLNIDWKNFKDRGNKEVLGSIIRRFADTDKQKPKESKTKEKVITKSISFDEKLAQLVPEFDSLPPETQRGCSLDMHRTTKSLPFVQLAAICPSMSDGIGGSFCNALSAAICESRDGTHSIGRSRGGIPRRRFGFRKMSDPGGVDYFFWHRQDSNSTEKDQEGIKEREVKADHEIAEGFEDKKEDGQHGFRARTQAIRLRDGERRRRLTEPSLYIQDFTGTDHL